MSTRQVRACEYEDPGQKLYDLRVTIWLYGTGAWRLENVLRQYQSPESWPTVVVALRLYAADYQTLFLTPDKLMLNTMLEILSGSYKGSQFVGRITKPSSTTLR